MSDFVDELSDFGSELSDSGSRPAGARISAVRETLRSRECRPGDSADQGVWSTRTTPVPGWLRRRSGFQSLSRRPVGVGVLVPMSPAPPGHRADTRVCERGYYIGVIALPAGGQASKNAPQLWS
jgi:hypothetical protein